MRRLDGKRYERARSFVLTQGGALPRAIFRALFEDGTQNEVLAALAAYQNEDGGFGHGIEPDFQLPASSPMATSVAFTVLRDVGATGDVAPSSVAGRGVDYLLGCRDESLPGWHAVPLAVNDHPHAPWWERSPASFEGPLPAPQWGNPNAELVGVLVEHASLVPDRLAGTATRDAVERLAAAPAPIDPYVCLSYLRLAAVAPTAARDDIVGRLRADAPNILGHDPMYAHFPYHWLAPTPDAPLADTLAEHVEVDLDARVDALTEEGFWEPGWSWGPTYPDAWAKAREEWRAELTVRTLRALRAYGRIEGV